MKKAIQTAQSSRQGHPVACSGRLGGAEMARYEWYARGACRCTRCARTSTTDLPRRGRRTGRSLQGVDLRGEVLPEGGRRKGQSAPPGRPDALVGRDADASAVGRETTCSSQRARSTASR